MSKVFRVLVGVVFVWSSLYMAMMFPVTLTSGKINHELIDSLVDKIMWGAVMLGCSGISAVMAIAIIKNTNLYKIKYLFMLFAVMFLVGIYYSFIFNSPW